MSSSYVEVREAENGTEENALPIAIDTCESNGIVPMSQIDGEPQKDHTYNKEPLEVQGEVEVLVSSEEVEDMEVSITSPEKSKRAKKQRPSPSKKTNKIARSLVKKESPKKTPLSPQKKVIAKEKDKPKVAKKEESVSDEEDKLDVSLSVKDSSLTKKRGQKRKSETTKVAENEPKSKKEKLDVKKSKLVKSKAAKKEDGDTKEDQQKTENDIEKTDEEKADVKEAEEKSPTKPLKKTVKTPSKTPKETAGGDVSTEDDLKLPEGWTRKVVQRKSGKTAGQFDVYIYSPDGKKLRSRPDIAAYLAKINSPLTTDDFSFSLKPGGSPQSTPPVKKSRTTPAKMKSAPKASSVTGKKKTAANNSKKGVRLVVKLNFSPKKRILSNYEEQEKTEKLGDTENSEGGKKANPKKSSEKKQKAQAKKKTTKQTPSKK